MTNTKKASNHESREKKSIEESQEKNLQFIVFELDKEEYAVAITDLQEIIRMPDITPIPNSPEFITGISNLRGRIIIVIDLEKRFDLKRDNEKVDEGNIIITEINDNNYGVIVDEVKEIINIKPDSIQATPDLISTKIHADYLKGVIIGDEQAGKEINNDEDSRLIILLDLSKMLQEKELLSISEQVQETIDK